MGCRRDEGSGIRCRGRWTGAIWQSSTTIIFSIAKLLIDIRSTAIRDAVIPSTASRRGVSTVGIENHTEGQTEIWRCG